MYVTGVQMELVFESCELFISVYHLYINLNFLLYCFSFIIFPQHQLKQQLFPFS